MRRGHHGLRLRMKGVQLLGASSEGRSLHGAEEVRHVVADNGSDWP
jgi:hypothetical protein